MIQKKIRSLIYAGLGLILCVLLCGGIGMTAQAESYGDFSYEENESGITITGYTGNKTKLVIPEEIDGKKVISIGGGAFYYRSGLTSVTIPKSVTSIGEDAFNSCSGLTSITIPKGVTSIGNGAFARCSSLTSIKVSKENKYYDSRNNCNAIIEIKSKTLVSGCKKTAIPKGVISIGEKAFDGCSDLKSITIPKGVTSIGYWAFRNCSSLTSITIPEGVTSIECGAFVNCSGLTSITIPKSVTSIGGDPDQVDSNAFASCSGLTSIIVDKENKYYDSRNNCNAIIETKSNKLVSGCNKTVIPDSVTGIKYRAFVGCSGLKSITIPKNVTWIGGYAFGGCSGLTSIMIPKSVTWIGEYAFGNCSGLTSITIPKSVTYIGEDAFGGCKQLVISCYKDSEIYKYAKVWNTPVKIIPATENPWKDAKKDDSKPATPAKKGTTLTVSSKKLQVKVTSSSKKNPTVTVTKITDKKAKKFTIPATVKVKGVTYKVTAVSDRAFKGNKKLTTVTIGKNVTKIGKEAFSGCKNLKKITVTAGKLKTISKNAFKGINKKATITVKGTKKAKTALKKQLKKKSIGYVKTWKIK